MHRIDTPSAQKDKFGVGKNGFTRGNPQTGTAATKLDNDYFDSIQEEICGVIEGAGIALDKTKRTQLAESINKLIGNSKAPAASTTVAGIVQLNSAINSTAENQAATPKAVKTAYDLANAALPKEGGTLSGGLSINGNNAYFDLIENSNNRMRFFINNQNGGIGFPNQGSTSPLTRLRFTQSTNTWNFENSSVTINNTSVLKQGDGGIDTRSLPILPDFKSLTNNSGIYRAFGSRTPNTATPNAPSGTGNSRLTVTVRNDGSVAHYEVTENALGAAKKWIGECYSSSGSLVINWVESITTANINSYVVTETILYPSGSESSPPTINNNQRIVIDNPYPSSKTIVELEIKPTTGSYEWGTYSGGDDNGQPVYSGIKANKLGSKIVIQTANNYILRPSANDCNPFNIINGEHLSSVYYRIRVLKIGA